MERWLTGEEEERLLKACPEWLRDMVIFALNTGFRQGEILSLTWNQVDWERKAILFWDQKNNGRDTVPVNETALDVLKRIRKVRSLSSDHVFLTSNGTPFIARNVVRAFSLALEKPRSRISDGMIFDTRSPPGWFMPGSIFTPSSGSDAGGPCPW